MSKPEDRSIMNLIGYGIENREWGASLAMALGHAGGEEDDEHVNTLLREAIEAGALEVDPEDPELLRKLKKGSTFHAVDRLLRAIEDITPQWIG